MPGSIHCELVSWERFHALARQLALSISRASFRPDLIVAIGRGGYLPARMVSDYLGIYDLAEFRIEHYRGVHKERVARVRYPLTAEITGKRVLLIDDVNDSGDTLDAAIRHLQERGESGALATAVLHHKTVSSLRPDFYAEEVREWRWIIYPWAVMEDLRSLLHGMEPPPASVEAFARLLRERHGIEAGRQTLEDVLTMAPD
ncbi:MAG: phosphoribosyltransferase [Gammaproteobacteria bacterium]|jgi:hypoxanthine phosphoribosyltransferase